MTLRGRLRQWNEVPRRDLLDGDVQIGAQPDEGSREGVSVGHGDVVCEVNVLGSDFEALIQQACPSHQVQAAGTPELADEPIQEECQAFRGNPVVGHLRPRRRGRLGPGDLLQHMGKHIAPAADPIYGQWPGQERRRRLE